MGTRNLTCVIKNGDFRIAQYGQWDGYPSAAGRDILEFLSVPTNIERLRSRVDDVRFVPSAEWTRRLEAVGIGSFITCGSEQERQFQSDFWQLDRNVGRKILDIIASTDGPVELDDSREFAHDAVFCEWAYVVDLDRNVLEVYSGRHKSVNIGVFATVPGEKYNTVSLVKSYELNKLPTIDELIKDCEGEE